MQKWTIVLLVGSACGSVGGDGNSNAWEPDEGSSAVTTTGGAGASDTSSGSEGGAETDPPATTAAHESSGANDDDGTTAGSEGPMCLEVTAPCTDTAQCCGDLECDTTSLGQVCCGLEGATCTTKNGEDCCGDLLCLDGVCGHNLENVCESPCTPAPALTLERNRLEDTIGG